MKIVVSALLMGLALPALAQLSGHPAPATASAHPVPATASGHPASCSRSAAMNDTASAASAPPARSIPRTSPSRARFRTVVRTSWPAASNCRMMWLPTKPEPPVTRTVLNAVTRCYGSAWTHPLTARCADDRPPADRCFARGHRPRCSLSAPASASPSTRACPCRRCHP